ncbi:MAG TPA: hypothetical protein VD969_23695 [Symbiobacteriaceae bacterium]|nr:hypothetical protein [Symbiobacteriaceae bacterium]
MRRGLKIGQTRPVMQSSTMSRKLDWVLDQWRSSSPEARLQLVLAKIREEEKLPHEPNKREM